MDPYLEGSTWMNFHSQLCAEIVRQLSPKIRPRYMALLTERFITEIPEGLAITTASLSPDVGIIEFEIDLLRHRRRVPMREPLPKRPDFVFSSRFETRPVTDLWPIEFAQPLPVVPVPLMPSDPHAPLDLQLAFSSIYDLCSYDLLIDYSRTPTHPLPRKAAAWVEKCLVAAGLRKRRKKE